MKQVSLYEAKTHLSKLVDEAAAGEEIVIAKNGKPMARLRPLDDAQARTGPRRLGQWAEQNKHIDWDKWDRDFKAADKEIERLFNEGDVPSALDEMAPQRKKTKAGGFAEKGSAYKARRKGRART
ncbi:MAG: type II toxin-antitoxin system Phd/YefM family antitoxin [Micropepsaceae bacterium]